MTFVAVLNVSQSATGVQPGGSREKIRWRAELSEFNLPSFASMILPCEAPVRIIRCCKCKILFDKFDLARVVPFRGMHGSSDTTDFGIRGLPAVWVNIESSSDLTNWNRVGTRLLGKRNKFLPYVSNI